MIDFLLQTWWTPVLGTWIKEITAVFFATWPGLTENLVRKHCSRTPETEKGHMKADRQNITSIKNANNEKKDENLSTTKAR